MKPLRINSRLWIFSNEGPFLGEGRVVLLKSIDELGSITKAAKSMKMSYLKAWKLVQSMNETASQPLVIKSSGGKGGGGATLTKQGYKAIQLFTEINRTHDEVLNRMFEEKLSNLL